MSETPAPPESASPEPVPPQPGRARSVPRLRAIARPRDDWRLVIVIVALCLCYGTVALRMGLIALEEPAEPRLARSGGGVPVRGEITDRAGRLIAANLPAFSLYAHPREIKNPARVARELAGIFPDMTEAGLRAMLERDASFVWVRRPITPSERRQVLDLGHPGLRFGSRSMRVYPPGRTVAHIAGGVRAAAEDVRHAELVGAGGVEGYFDARLRDPARLGEPLALSIDLGAQAALREVLAAGMAQFTAKGAAAVMMDVTTGEVLAMVSLPDFDPNARPEAFDGPAELDPRFNRAAQGRYELGSTFKVLTAGIALDAGVVGPDTLIETGTALSWGRHRIRDMHRMPPEMTVTDIVVRSSNVGAARLALRVGTPRLKDYLKRLGFFDPLPLELAEAERAAPLLPPKWTDLSTMTISFGHGLAASPVHLASAFATLANGGKRVRPTLVRGGDGQDGERVFSPDTSRHIMSIVRQVVSRGTGRRTNVPGYEVGGKTGTADKYRPGGGYYRDRVISTFVSVFPTSSPRYVLAVSLDEPTDRSGKHAVREASRTAAPVTAAAIGRLAPLLGMRPLPVGAPAGIAAVAAASQ
ncbi:MAG TPA: penicillin-binding protein 2 [Thermohalobaculum sp.]|nr:penicillin-binding protein 2 [Thermohalobaculum sp.]